MVVMLPFICPDNIPMFSASIRINIQTCKRYL
uniref:Uncharacterized protein n=1 Tax=Nelumbo nucifera TaxID=4432 RepID=A0A822Z8S5_NELNU|nr:TPA_asm: hypothetical protein HUJ06_015775 [Nelumbo nucifera]